MRLIDAVELKEWIENWFYKNKMYHPYAKSNNIPIDELYDILNNIPTIDAEPVRHGHWILVNDDHNTWECSKCDLVWTLSADTPEENEMYYCPKCGAKMDEVKDNE